jgi:hypothetical protein
LLTDQELNELPPSVRHGAENLSKVTRITDLIPLHKPVDRKQVQSFSRQAQFAYGSLVLGSSQFSLLTQLSLKLLLDSKLLKNRFASNHLS